MIRHPLHRPGQPQAGYYLIGLLIVIVIILILMKSGPLEQDPVTGVTQYETTLDRTDTAVCATNRKTIEGDVISWQIVNSGQKPNMEIVKRKFNLPPCPGGGVYTLGEDGSVYCTVHNPPPIEDLQKQVTGGAGP